MKILIVDDRSLNLKLLRAELEAEGHAVREAADGIEALALLERELCDAIISDILMPKMDGYRLCHEVRKNARLRELPFIFYTASYTSPSDEKLSFELGADKYLKKSCSAEEILAALHEATRCHASRREKTSAPMDTLTVMQEYNAVLVDKLEEKNLELEATVSKLREQEERFRQLAENVSELFWMCDKDITQVLYVSPAYEKICGRPCQSLYDDPQSFPRAVHPEDRERFAVVVQKQRRGEETDDEYRIVRPDGTARWIRARSFPVRNQAGAFYRIAGVTEDITERKSLEEQFLRAQRLEAIGTLAGGVAHDLNNILAPMLMAASLLKHKLGEPRDRDTLALVENGAQRGAGIIRQLLGFSRGMEGSKASLQPRHLLGEMMHLMEETFPRNIEILGRTPATLWNVVANATQLHQVLLNLCVNARDAMPGGGRLTLSAENRRLGEADAHLHPAAKPGPYVVLRVADTGSGIPPEIKHRIFDPFFTTKEEGKGTGLGLSTVQGIVASHGGFITLESEPNRGTTFQVYLPATGDTGGTMPAVAAADIPEGHAELILVVDDEEPIRETTRLMLEGFLYRVVTACNGEDAIKRFIEHRDAVRLVVTDAMMPVLGGVELVRALRVLEPKLKVVAYSGLASEDKRSEFAELGVTEFLAKPCTPEFLIAAINRALANNVPG